MSFEKNALEDWYEERRLIKVDDHQQKNEK